MALGEEVLGTNPLGTEATQIFATQPLVLDAGKTSLQSIAVALPSQTSEIVVRIRRPTTALPQNWDATSTIKVTLVYTLDGVEHRCTGQATGGIRLDLAGVEMPFYELRWHPTTQRIDGTWKRIGEQANTRSGYVLIERVSGTIDTEIVVVEAKASAVVEAF